MNGLRECVTSVSVLPSCFSLKQLSALYCDMMMLMWEMEKKGYDELLMYMGGDVVDEIPRRETLMSDEPACDVQ